MGPTRTLPDHYREAATLDLSKNTRALVLLNLLGALLFGVSGAIFLILAVLLRPVDGWQSIAVGSLSFGRVVVVVFWVIAIQLVMLVVHEGIHGLFFWIFTRTRPRFGVGRGYAYATAPGWYLPRRHYFVVSLAPLVVMSLGGVALLPFVSTEMVWPLVGLLTFNASGAIGDIAVAVWLLAQPPGALAQDRGDAVSMYMP